MLFDLGENFDGAYYYFLALSSILIRLTPNIFGVSPCKLSTKVQLISFLRFLFLKVG
jgi:hypothetical protein